MEVPPITSNVLVSDEVYVIINWILYGVILVIICVFGIASNIINIICFVRQGLNDPVNVSVLGLAISDLGSLVTSLGTCICYGPALRSLDLPVEMAEFGYIIFDPPFLLFTGVTAWITAFISLERCLCIAMPMKVKTIITSKRVIVVMASIFILLTGAVLSMHWIGHLAWIFSPEQNRTLLRLMYTDQSAAVAQISYTVNGVLIPYSAHFTIVICTLTLVVKLRSKAKWRRACTTSASAENVSKRDQKVAKMVMAISVMFIVCYTPVCISAILIIEVPALDPAGPNHNLLYLLAALCTFLQCGNSSANIFIYYNMSSRYRLILKALFVCRTDTVSVFKT